MTNNELLEKLDSRVIDEESDTSNYLALRAVVQLHRPVGDMCLHCGEDTYYPCPTIQAIEKELQ